MNRIVIILLSFIFLSPVEAQYANNEQQRVRLQMIVRDAESFSPLENSQVFINRVFYGITDSTGTFSVLLGVNDTVECRLLGYRPALFVLSDSLSGRDFMAGIYLNTDTVRIGEVIIVPRLVNLKSDIFRAPEPVSREMENARANLALSAYQAKASQGKLGDPLTNYEVIKMQQRTQAYEKGQIPSSAVVAVSPFMIVPALYLLMNGLPPGPMPMKPDITEEELLQIHKKYLELQGTRK
ncbi:MAG: hypothetical protein GT598_13965 [Bacteroidales bacterium]|nr:hypothetical protein [Bacteroidales bacterium]HPM18860.1 hypothetical protein [Bacteroidales bacterium]